MHETIASIVNNASGSKSTDKLALLVAGLEMIPQHKIERIKSFSLRWESLADGEVVVPFCDIQFFD